MRVPLAHAGGTNSRNAFFKPLFLGWNSHQAKCQNPAAATIKIPVYSDDIGNGLFGAPFCLLRYGDRAFC
jgi:hypothetical protein